MLKALYKKFKGVYQDVIGTATVVAPEVVINKSWNPTTEKIDTALRVPSKNFYDYLGHVVVPDEGLISEAKGGLGLGLGPYNNDLGHAVDKDTFSSPGPIAMNTEYIETGNRVTGSPGRLKFTHSGTTGSEPNETYVGGLDSIGKCVPYEYVWEGDWGDTENKFQTSATFQVRINYEVLKTGGGVTSFDIWVLGSRLHVDAKPNTAAIAFNILCGSKNDQTTENIKLYYNEDEQQFQTYTEGDPASAPNPVTYTNGHTFFNPHYSSGNYFFRDHDIGTLIHTFTVYRKPFEESVQFYTSYAGEAGRFEPFPSDQWADVITKAIFLFGAGKIMIDALNIVSNAINIIGQIINIIIGSLGSVLSYLGFGGISIPTIPDVSNLGNKMYDALKSMIKAIFDIINIILRFFMGEREYVPAYLTIDVNEIYREEMTIDQEEFAKTKMAKRWNNTIDKKSYMFSQMYYPYIFENPIFPYAYTFSYREPFLQNAVVKNNFYNDSYKSNNPFTKLNKYFVPSLFSLLYETNLGVFYEQLVKLHKNEAKSKTKPDFNLNIKLVDYNVPEDNWKFINEQKKCVYDLFLPSNLDYAENLLLEYANNTGYLDSTEATGPTTALIVPGATPVDSKISATLPSEYASVYTDYPFLNGFKSSVAGINTVIGNFTDLKAKIDSLGYDLEQWTELCNTNSSEFQTLSSGSPKNLSYKLVEYILWYIEPQGIIEQTRQSVQALIGYEKLVNNDIEEWRKSADGSEYDKFHIVGTDIYERNCPPS